MKQRIIPSIIAKTQKELEELLTKMKSHVTLVQLDIMDGTFVKNKSLWFNMKLPKTKMRYEAHLMVKNPKKWIEREGKKVDTIIIHFEATKNHHELIKLIKQKKKRVGIAIKPETPIKKLIGVIDHIDQITIMTVHPGKYGATFLPETLKKVRYLRNLSKTLDIEVDGGINEKTIKKAKKSGANKYISGSYLLKQESIKKGLRTLRDIIR